jgi:hypothetical protein
MSFASKTLSPCVIFLRVRYRLSRKILPEFRNDTFKKLLSRLVSLY